MRTSKSNTNQAKATEPGIQGQQLREWIDRHFDVTGVEPLVDQLVALSERLAAVRADLKTNGMDCRLVGAETKLLTQYTSVWKLAGFADPEEPAKRGRPTGPPMQRVRR
jgi:hypothetical protein